MQPFRPLPSFQRVDTVDLIEGESISNISNPPSITTLPQFFSQGQSLNSDTRITEQLEHTSNPSQKTTGTLSLTAALQATLTARATDRLVIIPASMKRKQADTEDIIPIKRMSPRLRHGIALLVIVLVLITTLLSLSPLATGQGGFPIITGVGNWVHAQQLSWQIISHDGQPQASKSSSSDLPTPPPVNLPKSQYIAIAQQDAMDAGISPDYFVRQINLESGFNPNAYSGSGAEGIAQFMPGTAAGLGINPWDPIQALRAAAKLMASYNRQYGGDYAKALAAYNGGSGTVQYAVNNCGSNWLNCLPGQTRNYIRVIMGI